MMDAVKALENARKPKSGLENLIGIKTQEKIKESLSRGNRVEITPTKGGVRVREIKANVIQ